MLRERTPGRLDMIPSALVGYGRAMMRVNGQVPQSAHQMAVKLVKASPLPSYVWKASGSVPSGFGTIRDDPATFGNT
jgi:hypothetical protein